MRLGARVTSVAEQADGVLIEAEQGGRALRVHARYVVGCDGSRSVVREAMKVGLRRSRQGRARLLRRPDAVDLLPLGAAAAVLTLAPAWTYWVVNPQQRGVLIAIDGRDLGRGVQLKPGQTRQSVDVAATISGPGGRPIDYSLIDAGTWLAGYMLVAERFRAGRCFVVGDAAHLFTPAAGMGYNTSIDDAVNLGWKLAAVVRVGRPTRC